MDQYKTRNSGNDGYTRNRRYRSQPPGELPSGFPGKDTQDTYERSIERFRKALANSEKESEKGEREQKDDSERGKDNGSEKKPENTASERREEVPDIIEQLEGKDWRSMQPDVMSQFWTEKGNTLSPEERDAFFEIMQEKMNKESEALEKIHSEILGLRDEMLINTGEMKAATDGIDILEKQLQSVEHGAELQFKPDGQNQNDLHQAEILLSQVSGNQEDIARVEVEAPLQSANQISSEITSKLQSEGFEHVSTEIQPQTSAIETQFNKLESELDAPAFAPVEIEQQRLKKTVELDTSEMGNGEFG